MTEGETRPLSEVLWLGVRGRCPRCGEGALFSGYLDVAQSCNVSDLSFGGHDAGEGPAVFVMFILGFVVVGLALGAEIAFQPSLWVHAVLWTPLIIFGALGLLRPSKGLTVALQYRFRAVDEPTKPGGA
jgi:uncharacterized protein (DUF983 family)